MSKTLTPEEIEALRRNYKRCGEATVEAILRYRESHALEEVALVGKGIIRRYLKADAAQLLDSATPDMPLADLQVESLTLLEIVLDLQDALEITIEDEELREFKTVGDVLQFLEAKVTAGFAS